MKENRFSKPEKASGDRYRRRLWSRPRRREPSRHLPGSACDGRIRSVAGINWPRMPRYRHRVPRETLFGRDQERREEMENDR